jgi:hypothetical protein
MAYTTRVNWEPLRSIDSSTFTGNFMRVGSPLVYPSYVLKMVNMSSVLVTISIDGVTEIDVAPANSFWLYDEQKTQSHEAVPAGTQVYVKGVSGSGLVYLVTQYLITP